MKALYSWAWVVEGSLAIVEHASLFTDEFRLNWNCRCCCDMLAKNGFSFMSNILGAGVSIGVCGIRKPPEDRLPFITSAEVFMEGAVVKLWKWSCVNKLPPECTAPAVDIAQLSSILIIVLLRVDGIRCEFSDGTLLTMLIRDEESLPVGAVAPVEL